MTRDRERRGLMTVQSRDMVNPTEIQDNTHDLADGLPMTGERFEV